MIRDPIFYPSSANRIPAFIPHRPIGFPHQDFQYPLYGLSVIHRLHRLVEYFQHRLFSMRNLWPYRTLFFVCITGRSSSRAVTSFSTMSNANQPNADSHAKIYTANTAHDTIRNVVVVGGTHGNEYTGVWCIKALEYSKTNGLLSENFPSLAISTLLGNPQAYLENKRFVQTDLNREFSHEKLVGSEDLPAPLTVESRRAQEVNLILGPKFGTEGYFADVAIDLHTTTANMGITLIVPEGDVLMAQAAAYVMDECNKDNMDCRCLLHTHSNEEQRPNLSSAAKHGFTIEVGPVPQGVLRHDAAEKTERAMYALFEFFHKRNTDGSLLATALQTAYPSNRVPCYRSAPAKRPGEMSGKITWPSHPDNPNFPNVMVHKDLQDRDFQIIRKGDPLFVNLDGTIEQYNGSHGDEVYLIFVNEGGYYYASSGTGIGVAVKTTFDLNDGTMMPDDKTREACQSTP